MPPARILHDRRHFLRTLGTGLYFGGPLLTPISFGDDRRTRPKIAAVFTDFRYRYHAHVILENFLEPYLFNGQRTDPECDMVSFYADQFHPGDMAREVSAKFGIPIFPTIREALTLGGDTLAV